MANPDNSPPSQPESKQPPERPAQRGSRRPDRNQPNTFFWYLLIGVVVVALVFSFSSQVRKKGTEVKFSDFYTGIEKENGTFRGKIVYELKFTPDYITFQDTPSRQSGSSTADSGGARETNYFYIPAVGLSNQIEAALADRLMEKNIPFTYSQPPAEWQTVAYVVLLSITILALMVFVFRRLGGAGAAMSFGRSRGKMFAQEDIEVTFDQVAGINEAVEELREIVEFLRTPAKYQALGGRIPRGVLLVGPPGTGKTLLAKAVAGEAGVPFFSLSGSDFVEMFVGVGAARVRDMFAQATQRSPSIIFIDELDALGKVRGSGMPGGHDEREQTLNALLVEMDGFASDLSVIVMGATNRPETLDPALLRPGRFDRHVLVDRPDIRGREAILKVHVSKVRMDDDVDLHRIAKLTPGFVGADLANLVNEAALLAARKDNTRVTMVEFDEGIERVVAGLQKQTRIISDDEKQRVAYHECGHALVACTLPNTDPVHKISIIPRGLGALGYTMQLPEGDRQLITQSELENRICVLLGGITAEDIVFQETSTGAQNDLERATDLAHRMVTEFGMSPKLGRVRYRESARSPFLATASMPIDHTHSEDTAREIDLELKRIIAEASETAYDILSNRRGVLEHMSRELLERETMDAVQLQRILDEHKTGPQIKPGTLKKTPEQPSTQPEADGDLPKSAEN